METELRADIVEPSPPKRVPTRFWALITPVLLVTCVLVASAWGRQGSAEIYEEVPHALVSARRLPAAVPAVPAFALRKGEAFTSSEITRLGRASGVATVATVTIERITVVGGGGDVRVVDVGAVEPLVFRNVASPAMRDADFVWTSLIDGDAVVTHDAAKRLDLGNDPVIRFAGGAQMAVGAFADNGSPNIADVLVSEEQRAPGLQDPLPPARFWAGSGAATPAVSLVSEEHVEPKPKKVFHVAVVGAESGAAISSLRDTVERRVPGARLERLLPKAPRVAPRADDKVASGPAPSPAVAAPVAVGLHPVLAESVARLVSASENRVWVVSGYRTSQHQYGLWLSALQRYGTPEAARHWVAPPGYSAHERGLAVDLGGDLARAARLIEELRLPLWRPMTWEPWHFELVGSRG